MAKRSEEYYAKQREYDRARRERPARRSQIRAVQRSYRQNNPETLRAMEAARDRTDRKPRKADRRIIGVDGEGQDTPDGRHIYTYLAAVDEFGELVADAYNGNGLSHEECISMLLTIPRNALKFGFMFSYDVTKIIEEMPAADRFYLMRPKAREGRSCKKCKGYVPKTSKRCPACQCKRIRKFTRSLIYKERSYDFFNGSLTVSGSRILNGEVKKPRSTKVWDCFRFFGCAFVEALKDWQIGSPDQVQRISDMKQKRGAFDQEDPESVKRYCQEECELLAQMMRKVIDAHEAAGIPLKRFDGAGSTATALLTANKVADFKGPRHSELKPGLAHAIECAFFGGRFEDSVVGIVEKPVYGFDISSAYPFSLSGLPCLACRGRWKFVPDPTIEQLQNASLALAKFRVKKVSANVRSRIAWCPLPFRSDKGSISYGTNFTGWAWAPELLPALRGWSDLVELVANTREAAGGAWLYTQGCDHKPFAFLPAVYRQRIKWGKEGAGKALKLGANACVTGDTRILTGVGQVPISDLVGAGVEVIGGDGRLHHAATITLVGVRDVYLLKTRAGREIRLTDDHLVSTYNRGDVRAWELTRDDEIEVADGVDWLASFTTAGRAEVFDLTEVDTKHFIANGFLIHNSYGKTAQSVGDDPPFQSWIWAGMTTAITRGQILDAILLARDPWNVLTIATDGIFSLEKLPIETSPNRVWMPRDTGTSDLAKPLGGWERKYDPADPEAPSYPEGAFIAKPGLYYRLKPTLGDVRARGVGRREVHKSLAKLQAGFLKWDRKDMKYHIPLTSRRFYGAKHSIYGRSGCVTCKKTWAGVPEQRCPKCGEVGSEFQTQMIQTRRDDCKCKSCEAAIAEAESPTTRQAAEGRDAYGIWDIRTVKIAFDPYPKRERTGISTRGSFAYLSVRDLGGKDSAAYDVGGGTTSPEGMIARASEDLAMEQPDWETTSGPR